MPEVRRLVHASQNRINIVLGVYAVVSVYVPVMITFQSGKFKFKAIVNVVMSEIWSQVRWELAVVGFELLYICGAGCQINTSAEI